VGAGDGRAATNDGRAAALLLCPFGPMWSNNYPVEAFVDRVRGVLRRHGADPSRLVVAPMLLTRPGVHSLLATADVYLDSFPHTGSHSLFDAIEAGLPCVSLLGQTFRGRHGPALLLEMGLDDLVARDVTSYERTAMQLGRDAALRQSVRWRMREAQRPLFLNPSQYCANLAKRYERLAEPFLAR
jgi:predicted O-linked N-acetylglucosamine transferase (SPINDLY family)